MANNFRVADKYTLERTIRKCNNCTNVPRRAERAIWTARGKGNRLPKIGGTKKERYSFETIAAESYIAIIEETCARLNAERERNPFTRTGWYTPFSPKSKVSGVTRANDRLESSRWHFRESRFVKRRIGRRRSAPRVLPSVLARIEMRFNAMQIHRDATWAGRRSDAFPYFPRHGTAVIFTGR